MTTLTEEKKRAELEWALQNAEADRDNFARDRDKWARLAQAEADRAEHYKAEYERVMGLKIIDAKEVVSTSRVNTLAATLTRQDNHDDAG